MPATIPATTFWSDFQDFLTWRWLTAHCKDRAQHSQYLRGHHTAFLVRPWITADSGNPAHTQFLVDLSDLEEEELFEALKELNKERCFVEELVYKRLTFLITIAGSAVAGAIATRTEPIVVSVVMLIGALVAAPFVNSIDRAYFKTCILLAVLVKHHFLPIQVQFPEDDTPPFGLGRPSFGSVGHVLPRRILLAFWVSFVLFAALALEETLNRREQMPATQAPATSPSPARPLYWLISGPVGSTRQ